ncbi:MAG: sugar-binding domain-containing protein [Bifidobacterium bifidum]
MRAQGAVATVCGHFIDAQGRPVCSELSDRIISVELDRLKRIALVIGVAWGQEKVKAIKACLVGSYISALATDQATAEKPARLTSIRSCPAGGAGYGPA